MQVPEKASACDKTAFIVFCNILWVSAVKPGDLVPNVVWVPKKHFRIMHRYVDNCQQVVLRYNKHL